MRGKHNRPVVEVFVDSVEGVTSDLCTAISRDVGKVLNALEGFAATYTLVVSSPGIERSLMYPWQYQKHVGRTLLVKSPEGELQGTLRAVGQETITLASANGEQEIAFAVIESAIVKAPW